MAQALASPAAELQIWSAMDPWQHACMRRLSFH